jgi:type I restriction enzyme S subunit
MRAWKTLALGEFAESVDYGVTASAAHHPVGPKFLRITDIQDGAVNWDTVPWCECDARSAADSRLKAGDIVFARTGATTGKSFLIRECPTDAVFASYLIRVRVSDAAEPRYLSHFFQTPDYWAQVAKGARGVAQPGVNATTLKALTIPLPPLAEQRRIAGVLDRAEALRAKRRAALARLDALTQAIFLDLFGDPATNPRAWPQEQLGELLAEAEVFVDGDWVESKDQDPNGEVRLVQLADIGDGIYINKSARFLNRQTAIRLKCTSLKIGDLLIARMPDPLGRACIFPGDPKESVTVVDVCIIRPARTGPDPVWLMCSINSRGFRGLIAREATGTTRERISRGNLSRLRIIAPPFALQRDFARRAAAVEKLKTAHRASLAELDALFASLQHRAFRGEL